MMFSRIQQNITFSRFAFAYRCVQNKNSSCVVQQYKVPNDNGTETEVNALQKANEDLSGVTPYFPQSYNLAGYVNTSESLQKLIQLNVNLSQIEKKPHIAEKILRLDFERNVKDHILFLKDYIDIDEIGSFITRNPLILTELLDDLRVRINYLESKRFSETQIKHIITKNPFWLMFSTTRIDRRLGFYQEKFHLNGKEVRLVTTKQSKLITYNLHHVNTNIFALKEEMGFNEQELKLLILHKPKLYMLSQKALLERFNFIHNVMLIPHQRILEDPEVLLSRNFRVKQRHLLLARLGRAQYDPKKENYVPIKSLVKGTDIEFCKLYAKCNVSDYNLFLKTL